MTFMTVVEIILNGNLMRYSKASVSRFFEESLFPRTT